MKIYSQNIGMEFGIEKCAIQIMRNGKRQKTDGIELPNQERIRILGKKENHKYLGKVEADAIKQAEMKEKKNKRVSQENEKTTPNQTIWQKSHQRDKNLGCPTRKILGTILEVDEERTLTNEPENKKSNDNA